MAQTVTGLQLLQLFLQRRGIGLFMANAQISLGATSLTSVFHLRNNNWQPNELRNEGWGLWRPGNATGIADDWRPAGDLAPSTGVVTVDTWADTTLGSEDVYALFHNIHPQSVIDAMNLTLRQLYFQNEEPLSLAADAGFQSTATTSYVESDADGGAATTFSKITTADSFNAWLGFIASGRVLNAAADGYIRQRFTVSRGEEVYVGWLVRADVGTAELGLYDVTNSAELGTQVTTTEEQWQYLWRRESVTSGSSGTETLEVRLRGNEDNADLYMNGLWVYRTRNLLMPLSTAWQKTPFTVPRLYYLTFRKNTATNVEDAFSVDRHVINPDDYDWLQSAAGANPWALQFHTDRYFQYPILIQGRRAHSDVDGPFTRVLTETTSADRDLFEAQMAVNFFKDPRVTCPNKDAYLAQAMKDLDDLSPAFPETNAAKPQVFNSTFGHVSN